MLFSIPGKGRIEVGFDADLVFLNIKKRKKIHANRLDSTTDCTPFEGISVTSLLILTIIGGEVIFKEDEFYGRPGFENHIF